MTTKYNAYYDFNFDTVVSKLYEEKIKEIDFEIDTTSSIMKTETNSVPVGPEKFKASIPFRDAINKLKKDKDLIL